MEKRLILERTEPSGGRGSALLAASLAFLLASLVASEAGDGDAIAPRPKPVATGGVVEANAAGGPDHIADILEDMERSPLATGTPLAPSPPSPSPSTPPAVREARLEPADARPDRPLPKPGGVSPVAFLSRAEFARFEKSFRAARNDEFTRALAGMKTVSDPTARSLVEWLYMRSSRGAGTVEELSGFMRRHGDWPEPDALRTRAEALLLARSPGARAAIDYFGAFAPQTGEGLAALADAYRATGNDAGARALAERAWRELTLSADLERTIAERCGCITRALEKERLDRMAYKGAHEAMLRAAKRLDQAHVQLARAHLAFARRSKSAPAEFDKVPGSLRGDTALSLSRATWLRRTGKETQARKIVLAAPTEIAAVLDAQAWWTERRLLARMALADRSLARDSYRLAAGHALDSGGSFADAEFLAGWIALRRLGDADLALRHFDRLRRAVDQPISVARAEYWLARANDRLGRAAEARRHRTAAAGHGVTYYGQLARNELYGGDSSLDLPAIGEAAHLASAAIEDEPLMRAARLLTAIGERHLAAKFLLRLAYDTSEPGALGRIGNLANLLALPQIGVRVGKIGVYGGVPVHEVAYPVSDFPQLSPAPDVEPELLLALTRQESEFAWQASSHAGARGLMQVMPATGKMLARQAGVAFSLKKLGEDPYYNARLGSSFLADLVRRFDGCYVLAIASYNAGPGRVGEWIGRFGDPRSGEIDVVDWIESIPFDETQNYVQRVLENLQVYRARTAGTAVPLRLAADLARGREPGRRAYALD